MSELEWQEAVSDRADEILDKAIKSGDSFSEGLCNWALDRAQEEIPKP